MTSFTVITSINHPTESVKKWALKSGSKLIVVGDRKSPKSWNVQGVKFLSFAEHAQVNQKLDRVLPADHYCRKIIGYVAAASQGAEEIVDTDDDNRPKANHAFPRNQGSFETLAGAPGWVNVYSYFSDKKIWPRGLPLDEIRSLKSFSSKVEPQRVGIWQGLADLDPDVDAIFRMVDGSPCIFEERDPLALGAGIWSPFNSQNTSFSSELFPLLYLPATVTFRFTDILRGVVAQPIMWAHGFVLGFCSASVDQDRNKHDLMIDFQQEIPMYLQVKTAAEIASAVASPAMSISENLRAVYGALRESGIVADLEMRIVDAWLDAIGAR
jgi:hypothetical protein